MYLTNTPDGDRFVWSIYVNDHVPKVPGVPISGSAATLDKATAAMLTSYGRMRAKAGLPQPQPNRRPSAPAAQQPTQKPKTAIAISGWRRHNQNQHQPTRERHSDQDDDRLMPLRLSTG